VKIALLMLALAGCEYRGPTCETCVKACKPFDVYRCQPMDAFAIDCKCWDPGRVVCAAKGEQP
jgi:hypothetical protein